MRGALGLIVVAALAWGCASAVPPPPPAARSTPQTAVISPVPAPAPLPPAPQVSPRVDNEEQATREVNGRLARASDVMAKIDASKLGKDQQEMLTTLKDFISKAAEALQARDLPRAQVLADKAARLADDLALVAKNAKATR